MGIGGSGGRDRLTRSIDRRHTLPRTYSEPIPHTRREAGPQSHGPGSQVAGLPKSHRSRRRSRDPTVHVDVPGRAQAPARETTDREKHRHRRPQGLGLRRPEAPSGPASTGSPLAIAGLAGHGADHPADPGAPAPVRRCDGRDPGPRRHAGQRDRGCAARDQGKRVRARRTGHARVGARRRPGRGLPSRGSWAVLGEVRRPGRDGCR